MNIDLTKEELEAIRFALREWSVVVPTDVAREPRAFKNWTDNHIKYDNHLRDADFKIAKALISE